MDNKKDMSNFLDMKWHCQSTALNRWHSSQIISEGLQCWSMACGLGHQFPSCQHTIIDVENPNWRRSVTPKGKWFGFWTAFWSSLPWSIYCSARWRINSSFTSLPRIRPCFPSLSKLHPAKVVWEIAQNASSKTPHRRKKSLAASHCVPPWLGSG